MATSELHLDQAVRRTIYDGIIQTGLAPSIAEVASTLAVPVAEVQASYRRLADAHILVLQQDSQVLMVDPFSAVPTPFFVQVASRSYFGNCIWDALGIPAMLKEDTIIRASCGDCGTAMTFRITQGVLEPVKGIAHFAIPAAHWWENIVYT